MNHCCLFCGPISGATPVLVRSFPQHVICRNCGFVFQSPLPAESDLARLYEERYWEERADGRLDDSPSPRDESIAGWLAPHLSASSLAVDLGCGAGRLLTAIGRRTPCRLLGVEPSRAQSEAARRLGLNVQTGGLEQAEFASATAVVLSHVLEHLVSPLDALVRCREGLSEGGVLLVEVPSLWKTTARKSPENWFSREHLWYFSPQTLERLLVRAGFRPVRSEIVEHGVRMLARPAPPGEVAWQNEYWTVRRKLACYKIAHQFYRVARKLRLI
jgi:SAM-dependent methyltransferase